jgi:hypothetical protein
MLEQEDREEVPAGRAQKLVGLVDRIKDGLAELPELGPQLQVEGEAEVDLPSGPKEVPAVMVRLGL